VLNSSGTRTGDTGYYSNVNGHRLFAAQPEHDAYIGQTVRIRFYGHEDWSLATCS